MTITFVYRCYDEDGQLLYVGASCDVKQRMYSHRSRTPWGRLAARVEVEERSAKPCAHAVERIAIRFERPLWNVCGRWSSREEWTEQDWRNHLRALEGLEPSANRPRIRRIALAKQEIAARFPQSVTA